MPLKGRRRFRRKMTMKGTKTEVTRKRVPRISTLNKKIKRIEDTRELKYHDSAAAGATVDDQGQLYLLNGIQTGDTQYQRTGAEVQSTSIQIRGYFTNNELEINGIVFRMIIFWDRQCNGAAPLVVSNSAGTPGLLYATSGGESVNLPFMYETNDRFRVIYDKRFSINPKLVGNVTSGETDAVGRMRLAFKKKIKLNRRVKYDDVNGVITDINTNSLWVVFLSNDTNTNLPTIHYNARYYFKDA